MSNRQFFLGTVQGRTRAATGRVPRGVGGAALAALVFVVAAIAWPPAVRADEFERSFTYRADQLTIANLIGAVRVEGGSWDEFKVKVNVQGEDASTDLITFEEHGGSHAELVVRFPTREHRKYVYPKLGRGSSSSFDVNRNGRDDDWLSKLFDLATGQRIQVRGSSWGGGIEVWADVVVQVPRDREVLVRLGVGSIDANDVQGRTELRTRSGAVSAENVHGELVIETGSGSVDVHAVRGEVDVETGSGGVDVSDLRDGSKVKVSTGSGGVRAEGIATRDLDLETGSGRVEITDADVQQLTVDTGSGGVDAGNVAADGVKIDTGSGGVDLDLARMGGGRFHVDTGSGGIRMQMPQDISADFDVSTGSGGIEADIEGVRLDPKRRHEAHFTVGDGDAQVSLTTGSGSVRLRQGRTTTRR